MTNFSTEFPIDPKNSVNAVMHLACKWIIGSPYTKAKKSDLQELPFNDEFTKIIGNDQVSLAHATTKEFEIGGMRYIRTENDLQWTTSIVTLKTIEKHLLSLQVTCEAMNTAVRLPPPKKPYFIKQALAELGGGSDGEIPVTDKPFRLSEGEEQVAAALILGTGRNTLPIVYVSAGFHEDQMINPSEIAKLVSGMAHVVVEPTRAFSYKVKNLTDAKNVFGGTVGIYWPNSNALSVYFIDEEKNTPKNVLISVAKDIRNALSNRRQITSCTWLNLKEVVSRNRFEQLKTKGSTELQEYIDAFDAELSAKQAKIVEAEGEIARLNTEIRRLSAATQSSSNGIIQRGNEQDLYQHEITDITIEALIDANRIAREGSRRQHVLQDLIKSNPVSGSRQAMEDEIKKLFKTYKDMDTKTRNALTRLGFELTEEGKHYKAIFQGDGRYTFSLSKSSSDHRSGKNLASDINNTIF